MPTSRWPRQNKLNGILEGIYHMFLLLFLNLKDLGLYFIFSNFVVLWIFSVCEYVCF